MRPLLAHIYDPHRVTFPCVVQPKLNGVRALYQNGAFQSRDELPWGNGILQHLADELSQLELGPQIILDGELYVHGWPLQRINSAVTPVRTRTSSDTTLVEYHVFDSADFTSSFEDRWASIPRGLALPHVHFVRSRLVHSLNEADAFYKEMVDAGYEGIMYRLGACPYTTPLQDRVDIQGQSYGPPRKLRCWSDKNNRTWHLLKRKSWTDNEFIIGAYKRTIGDKGEPGFQLTCFNEQGLTFNVGSGLTQKQQEFYEQESPVGRYAKIQFLCYSVDGIPLNPTILAVL